VKPMTNLIGRHHADLMVAVTEAIRTVSSSARTVPIKPGSLLLEELGLDSLDLVAVILEIQDRFQVEIDPDEIPSFRCVADLVASVTNHLRAAAAA
jgi:acyl carrier protein